VLHPTTSLTQQSVARAEYIDKPRWENIFYFIILFHIIAWTLTPYLIRFNLPRDALESSIWGQHFEWGYDKNPFLNGWLSGIATLLDNHAGWGTYFFSQLSVGICFLAVWTLAKKILPPLYALISVLLLEGVQYYSLHAIDFSDNTVELALWALTILSFYNALKYRLDKDWVLTGVLAALGMMTKYYMVMLLGSMLLFLISSADNRKIFSSRKPYLATLIFLILVMPHFIWLYAHDFITVHYAFERIERPQWYGHFSFSALFFWQQTQTFIPALLLGCTLLVGKKPFLAKPALQLSSFDKHFLLYLGLGPFLLTVLISAVTGMQLRAGWGAPLLSLWGILFIAYVQPRLTQGRLWFFAAGFVGLVFSTLTGYALALKYPATPSSANFPGAQMASVLTREWHRTYHIPLFYVAGSRWMAGNIAYYSPDHPDVYVDWDKKSSQWINEKELKNKGAIFIWDPEKNEKLTPQLLARFKRLGPVKILHFPWLRDHHQKSIEIEVAFLAPQMTII
jgi:4-amino-4-deoxy-L-arabinose transferase-like glycosyltransferase